MAMDQIRPLKMESPQEGGTQLDWGPTELNPLQDALTAAGLYVQDPAAATVDTKVLLDRTGASLRLTDGITSHVLRELVSSSSGQVGSHNALPDVIHHLAQGGPGDGYASGSFRVDSYSGPLLASRVWYTSAAQTQKIFAVTRTFSGPLVATTTYVLYDATGAQARQVVDTHSYSGPLCVQITRTWS